MLMDVGSAEATGGCEPHNELNSVLGLKVLFSIRAVSTFNHGAILLTLDSCDFNISKKP